MSRKVSKKDRKFLAKLVTGKGAPCAFCHREVDDEVTYGKLYAIGDIQCHYFCCLLSCCLIQKGDDEEGLFGFMYTDILAELERCTKHKCSYCNRNGANLGCVVASCRKQFHLPCGREKNAVSLYYGAFKSFCQQHAPKQKIPEHIMEKAKLRQKMDRTKNKTAKQSHKTNSNSNADLKLSGGDRTEETVCVICYESVDGFPTVNTFWPPCCARDAWFHRSCLQRMALSAGMHYLKCPLCNDKGNFYDAVVSQGYYVPNRDAAWELEQNAFAEIYERPVTCCADVCWCPMGRERDEEHGKWDIKLCLLCGSAGAHAQCITDQSQPPAGDAPSLDQSQNETACETSSIDQSQRPTDESVNQSNDSIRYVCKSCLPAAPKDLNALANNIEAIIRREQLESTMNARRPVMPSRMSLRRTKRRISLNAPSSSRSSNRIETEQESTESNTRSSRLELNLKAPRKPSNPEPTYTDAASKFLSPVKLLEQGFNEKMVCTGVRDAVLDEGVIETLRRRFRKPRPLCEKKRIVNNILEGLFDNLMEDSLQKEHLREWCSPQKNKEQLNTSKLKAVNQQKENNSNCTNNCTPTAKTDDFTTFSSNDLKKENKETPERNSDTCRNTRDTVWDAVVAEENRETERDIEAMPTRNKDNCKNTRNSVADRVITKENEKTEAKIEVTPTRTRNTRNSVSKTIENEEGNSKAPVNCARDIIQDISETEQTDATVQTKNVSVKKSPKGRLTKKKTVNKVKKSPKVFPKANILKMTDLQKTNENNKTQIETEAVTIEEEINKLDGHHLRKLLTDKDFVYQIPTELNRSKNNATNEISNKSEITMKYETPHIIETPKCKMIDIQQDSSLEISENDRSINIDVIKIDEASHDAYKNFKIPEKPKTCSFKFSPLDKETLENKDVGIDMENFKKLYLNEVDGEFNGNIHKHDEKLTGGPKIVTALDFAADAVNNSELGTEIDIQDTPRKRKVSESRIKLLFDNSVAKKRKTSDGDLKLNYNIDKESITNKRVDQIVDGTEIKKKDTERKKRRRERRAKRNKKSESDEKNIGMNTNSTEKRGKNKVKKKIKTNIAIQNENIHVRIKWRKKQLSLNIKSKKQAKKEKLEKRSKLNQYILQFSESSTKEVLMKPEKAVRLLKKKYPKQKRSPDKLKQTTMQSFFKLKSPEK